MIATAYCNVGNPASQEIGRCLGEQFRRGAVLIHRVVLRLALYPKKKI